MKTKLILAILCALLGACQSYSTSPVAAHAAGGVVMPDVQGGTMRFSPYPTASPRLEKERSQSSAFYGGRP